MKPPTISIWKRTARTRLRPQQEPSQQRKQGVQNPDHDSNRAHHGKNHDGVTQAHHLFTALRELDKHGAQVVYARCPEQDGVSMAVYNRLIRAAAFRVVTL